MMFQFKIAYRHKNNEVEGFVGTGTNPQSAERDALDQIRLKLISFQQPQNIDSKRIISNPKLLTKEELQNVVADWNVEARY